MVSERIIENTVREHFRADLLFSVGKLGEQRFANKKVIDLLQFASRSEKGRGMLDFLVNICTILRLLLDY